jgi:hypothetical protein
MGSEPLSLISSKTRTPTLLRGDLVRGDGVAMKLDLNSALTCVVVLKIRGDNVGLDDEREEPSAFLILPVPQYRHQ